MVSIWAHWFVFSGGCSFGAFKLSLSFLSRFFFSLYFCFFSFRSDFLDFLLLLDDFFFLCFFSCFMTKGALEISYKCLFIIFFCLLYVFSDDMTFIYTHIVTFDACDGIRWMRTFSLWTDNRAAIENTTAKSVPICVYVFVHHAKMAKISNKPFSKNITSIEMMPVDELVLTNGHAISCIWFLHVIRIAIFMGQTYEKLHANVITRNNLS